MTVTVTRDGDQCDRDSSLCHGASRFVDRGVLGLKKGIWRGRRSCGSMVTWSWSVRRYPRSLFSTRRCGEKSTSGETKVSLSLPISPSSTVFIRLHALSVPCTSISPSSTPLQLCTGHCPSHISGTWELKVGMLVRSFVCVQCQRVGFSWIVTNRSS